MPFTFQGSLQFLIRVTDLDDNPDDHVDNIYVDMSISPSSSFTSWRTYVGDYKNSRISLQFRVTCSSNYYGSNCATYCIGINNSRGHYTCAWDGRKMCLSGWSDPSRNCLTRELLIIITKKSSERKHFPKMKLLYVCFFEELS